MDIFPKNRCTCWVFLAPKGVGHVRSSKNINKHWNFPKIPVHHYKNNTPLSKSMVFNASLAVRCIHWFCLRGAEPKSMHKIGLNRKIAKRLRLGPGQRQSQKSMHPSLSGASTSLGSSRMCIDFLVPFRNVHWFFGEVPQCAWILVEVRNMYIDFPRKFPTCSPLFLGKFPTCGNRFSGETPYVFIIFERKLPTRCPSIYRGGYQRVYQLLAEVHNMRIHFAGKFRIFAWIFWWSSQHARRYFVLGKFPTRASIFWGSSQYVHVFFGSSNPKCPPVFWGNYKCLLISCITSHMANAFLRKKNPASTSIFREYVNGSSGKVSYMCSDFKGPTDS